LKEKKYLQQDNTILNKLRTDAEKILSKGVSKTGNRKNNVQLQELNANLANLEQHNRQLYQDNSALQQQLAKLINIYDLAPIGYFILDKAGVIEEVNTTGTSLLEGGKAELINHKLKNFITTDCCSTYQQFLRKMLHTRARQTCQLKMVSKARREFHAQLEGITIYTAANAQLHCYIAIVDTTERIQAEQHLAETKDRLELAMEAAAAGTWELELESMAFYLHEFNYHLCAVTANNFDGHYESFISLIHPDDQAMVDRKFRTAVEIGKELDLVCRFINADKKLCFAGIRGLVMDSPNHNKRLVGILMDITEKKLMEEEAAHLKKDQQKNITTAALTAGENERKRISEALHDSVSQLLYGIKMQLDQLQPTDAIKHIYELLDTAVKETRDISFALAPSILTDFGLPTTITELAHRLSTSQLQINTQIKGFTERLDLFLESCIFRIIQELINNCMKHSAATVIDLCICKSDILEIVLTDNGRGFNAKQQESKPTGSGFSSIKNRLGLYNGTLDISSTPGKGTTVRINLAVR
jgi:PAS domain S-box-containing protein